MPGDTLELAVTVKGNKNTTYRRRSPVRENGTFINNFALFPSLGYSTQGELTDNKTRKKYDLQKNDLKAHPSDLSALGDTYISNDSDFSLI